MACLEQYQEMERIANFYGTLVLNRGECVDSEYVNINPINETSTWSLLKNGNPICGGSRLEV